jgi:hypothetical protein
MKNSKGSIDKAEGTTKESADMYALKNNTKTSSNIIKKRMKRGKKTRTFLRLSLKKF